MDRKAWNLYLGPRLDVLIARPYDELSVVEREELRILLDWESEKDAVEAAVEAGTVVMFNRPYSYKSLDAYRTAPSE